MLRAIILSVLLATGLAFGAAGDPPRHPRPPLPQWAQDVMPLPRAVEIVSAHVRGELLRADLVLPEPLEFALGVNVVHELRILTDDRNLLLVRMDAQTGEILEIIGRGLSAARHERD